MSVMYIRGADGTFQPVPSLQGESVSALTVYPVGSVYISVSETSPASLFGGAWERIKDTFLLAAGDTYSAGSTGGEATHALTIAELPSHSHPYEGTSNVSGTDWIGQSGVGVLQARNTGYVGDNAAHNNMPPYYTVYMWRRMS